MKIKVEFDDGKLRIFSAESGYCLGSFLAHEVTIYDNAGKLKVVDKNGYEVDFSEPVEDWFAGILELGEE